VVFQYSFPGGYFPVFSCFGTEIKISEGLGVRVNNIKIRKLRYMGWLYSGLGSPEPVKAIQQAKAAGRRVSNRNVHEHGEGVKQTGISLVRSYEINFFR
jgi:hypothetical protein